MMFGVLYRFVRIVCIEDLVYCIWDGKIEWVIFRGIFIGMISMINYFNEEFFFNLYFFFLEWWLIDGKLNYKLQKFLIVFGKGSWLCIGESLVYCEVYFMIVLIVMCIILRVKFVNIMYEDNFKYDYDCIVFYFRNGFVIVYVWIQQGLDI